MAIALLLVELLFGEALVGFGADLLRGLEAVPAWMVDVVVVGTRILAVVVFGAGVVWAITGRPWRMLVTVALAVLLAELLVSVGALVIDFEEAGASVDVGVGLGPLAATSFRACGASVPSPPPSPRPHRGSAAPGGGQAGPCWSG